MTICHSVFSDEWKEVFIPMDFSTCGYHASEREIPDLKNVVYVSWTDSACSERIQKAIDYVSSLKPNNRGQRGAVLLGEGVFYIDKPLRVMASGVVIRGSGKQKTTLVKQGIDRGAAVYFEGGKEYDETITISLKDTLMVAGSIVIDLKSTEDLYIGQRIRIVRPSTEKWIRSLKCHDFGGGLDFTGWKPGEIDITWDRTITSIVDNSIIIDSPITTTLDPQYGGGYIIPGYNLKEISECGIENLTISSDYDKKNKMDENHCWDGVWMENTRDAWVRRVNFTHLAGSAVNIQLGCSRITVEDCIASEPISEIGGFRRIVFQTRGQQTLIQRCISRDGQYDFVAGLTAAGPNAFVQCEAENSHGFSGSIGSWASGLLFDIVNIDGGDIRLKNLEQFMYGTGWNSSNSMIWQSTGSALDCYSPDEDNWNSASGCWGMLSGDGEWTASNVHIIPRSLYYYLLRKRIGGKTIRGFVLPLSTNAKTSPDINEAQDLALESLTIPRTTLEDWIASVPYSASVSHRGVKNIEEIELNLEKDSLEIEENQEGVFAVKNGHITVRDKLIVGNRYHPPWWNGKIKESYLEKSAKPAITRFVPGREGTGLTDRIDSVVTYLDENNYCLLDHNYGLWYDLRRIDHERVRRADGNVWAPFYEQPFARTGYGKAWDGLSLYDLTLPNKWYWARLKEFAQKGREKGLLLFHENYFQHNILEAGAHWVDCPWRPVNNVNGTKFPEPVPFSGDKRIFMAEQFYSQTDDSLRSLHRQYIRQCLENFQDDDNVVQLIGEEFTGPTHFVKFWLETIKDWEEETGNRPMIALSCTKDAQDEILADSTLSEIVDIIDIRYWHYKEGGIYSPQAGMNLAPRQFERKMDVGDVGFIEVYKAVCQYRSSYPEKAVTYFSDDYDKYGWAVLMASGSCPNVIVTDEKFLTDIAQMQPLSNYEEEDCQVIGNPSVGYVIYSHEKANKKEIAIEAGSYRLNSIDKATGEIKIERKSVNIKSQYSISGGKEDKIYWLEKIL